VETSPSVTSFLNICGLNGVAKKLISASFALWNFTGLPNTVREFAFKFFNNQLGLNTRVSHFVADHPRHCTLCFISGVGPPLSDETFLHLFSECNIVANIRRRLIIKHFPELLASPQDLLKKLEFLGNINDNKVNLFLNCVSIIINFLVWRMKTQKDIIPFSSFDTKLLDILDTCYAASAKFREATLIDNFHICRRWNE
jgi:hypothetical protein